MCMVEFATNMTVWSCWFREQDRRARNEHGCFDCCSIQLSYLAHACMGRDGFEPPTNSSDNPQSTARKKPTDKKRTGDYVLYH